MDASEIKAGDRFEYLGIGDGSMWVTGKVYTVLQGRSGPGRGWPVESERGTLIAMSLDHPSAWKRLPAPEAKADVRAGQIWEVSDGPATGYRVIGRLNEGEAERLSGQGWWCEVNAITSCAVLDTPTRNVPRTFVRLIRDVPEAEPAKPCVCSDQFSCAYHSNQRRMALYESKPPPPKPEPPKVERSSCDPRCTPGAPCRRDPVTCANAFDWAQRERTALVGNGWTFDEKGDWMAPAPAPVAKPPRTGPPVPAWSGMGALSRSSWVAGSLLDRPSLRRGRR